MINNVMDFLLLYFRFWPNCFIILLTQVFLLASNKLVYNKDVDGAAIFECIGGLIY